MENNVYSPPQADLEIKDTRPGSLVKAVLVGAAIDIGGSLLLGMGAGLILGFISGFQGHSPQETQQMLSSFDRWSTMGIVLTVLGTLVSVFAGYQCASIAKRDNYLAPLILAVISVAFGSVLGGTTYPVEESIVMAGVTMLAVLGGAWLYACKLPTI